MLISLVTGAYLTNLPNLPDSFIINKSHVSNKNFCQSPVSMFLGSKLPCLVIQEQQQTLVASHYFKNINL